MNHPAMPPSSASFPSMAASSTTGIPAPQMYLPPEPSRSRVTSIASPFNMDSPASDVTTHDQFSSQAASSSSNKQRPYPCAACKKSKVKCDEVRPRCDRCTRREYECKYPSLPSSPTNRIRRFHRRSRNGCDMCKSRRVRCDEGKPTCKNCKSRDTPCIYQAVIDKSNSQNVTPEETTRLAEPSAEWGSPSMTPNPVEVSSTVGPHRYRSNSRRPEKQSLPPSAGAHPVDRATAVEMSSAQTSFGTTQHLPPPSISGYNAFGNLPSATMSNSSSVNLPPLNPIYLDGSHSYSPIFPHNPNFQFNPPDILPVVQPVSSYGTTATGSLALQAPPINSILPAIGNGQATVDRSLSYSDMGPSDTFNNFQPTGSRNPSSMTLHDRRVDKPSVDISTLFGGSSYTPHASRQGSVSSSHILLPDQQQVRPNGLATVLPMVDIGYSRQPVSTVPLASDTLPASLSAIVTPDSGSLYGPRSGDSLVQQEDGEEILEIQTNDLSAYRKLRSSHSAKEFSEITAAVSSHSPHARKQAQQKLFGLTRQEWEDGGTDMTKEASSKREIGVFSTDDGLVFKRFVGVEELKAYFPSSEQRQQYRHYVNETVEAIVAVRTPKARNPWRQHFVQMALAMPHGSSIAHDALRLGILSLSSFDMGFKMAGSKADREDNAMLAASIEHRADALKLLRTIVVLKPYQMDNLAADLAIGTAVSLCIRDRLAGEAEWKDPIKLGIDIIKEYGGPEPYLSADINPSRRFLLEQMACQEMISSVLSLDPSKLIQSDSTWMERYLSEEDFTTDHIEIVYGLDRPLLRHITRSLELAEMKRKIETLRTSMGVYPHHEVQASIDIKVTALQAITQAFIAEGEALKNVTLMTPHSTRVSIGNLGFLAFTDLWMFVELLDIPVSSRTVQGKVETVLELTAEALSRGMYTGLLLPMSWAASYAIGTNRDQSMRLLELLKPHCYIDHDLTIRLIRMCWRLVDKNVIIPYSQWEQFMRQAGCWAPIF